MSSKCMIDVSFAVPANGDLLFMPSDWTAISSSTYSSSYDASKVVDGFVSTYLHPASADSSKAYQWVQVNFGSVIEV